MSPIWDFVAGLNRAEKSFKEILEITEAAYSKNLLKKLRFRKLSRL
jgi:hypothetical protein